MTDGQPIISFQQSAGTVTVTSPKYPAMRRTALIVALVAARVSHDNPCVAIITVLAESSMCPLCDSCSSLLSSFRSPGTWLRSQGALKCWCTQMIKFDDASDPLTTSQRERGYPALVHRSTHKNVAKAIQVSRDAHRVRYGSHRSGNHQVAERTSRQFACVSKSGHV